MIKLSLKSWYLIDRYPARHPPSGSLQSGQLIGSLVRGGGGGGVRFEGCLGRDMFWSLLNIISEGRSLPRPGRFFLVVKFPFDHIHFLSTMEEPNFITQEQQNYNSF
jgi:hypothetical protein